MIFKCNHVGCGLVRRVSNSIDKIQVERKIQGDRLKLGYTEKEGQEREILHWQHGPTALTQLPDNVIAERCQNAAEKEHAHQAESKKKTRRGGRKGTRVKERERIKRSVQNSRCKCHCGKRSKRRESRAQHNVEFSVHTFTSDADLQQ